LAEAYRTATLLPRVAIARVPHIHEPSYRQAYALSVSDDIKALALARLARCLHKSNKPEEAEQAYAELLEKYGQRYDRFHRPYAVVATLELGPLTKSVTKSSTAALMDLQRDLAQGRWELSADQLDYFLAAIQDRVPAARIPLSDSAFLSHFDEDDPAAPRYILSIYGQGYKFIG
jgi:hypothetical protein